jgi:hypothetical protein
MDKIVKLTDAQKETATMFCPFADDAQIAEMFPEEDTTGSALPMPELPALPAMEEKKEEVKVVLAPKEAIDQIKALIAGEEIEKEVKKQGEEIVASLEELIKQIDNAQTFLDKNKKAVETVPPEVKA